jgi:hypothetical protein
MKFIDKLLENSQVIADLREENAKLRSTIEFMTTVNTKIFTNLWTIVEPLQNIDAQLNKSEAFKTTIKNVGDIIVKLLDYSKAITANHQSILNMKAGIEDLDKVVCDILHGIMGDEDFEHKVPNKGDLN